VGSAASAAANARDQAAVNLSSAAWSVSSSLDRLVDVQVDPDQDQRPKDRCEKRGPDLLDRAEMGPVAVRGGDYRPDDAIDEKEEAHAWRPARAPSRR
jgi:hypothetical protein